MLGVCSSKLGLPGSSLYDDRKIVPFVVTGRFFLKIHWSRFSVYTKAGDGGNNNRSTYVHIEETHENLQLLNPFQRDAP